MGPPDVPPSAMKFGALPAECGVDRTLAIRLHGGAPGEPVTVSVVCRFPGSLMRAHARFVADADGTVDLTRDAPVAGSYTGVDPMGLFWSRAPVAPGPDAGPVDPGDDPLAATLVAQSDDGRVLDRHAVRRVYVGPGVRQSAFDAPGRVGLLFEPDADGPHPAVLVVGGSDGGLGWSREVAALLASHGFVALALGYFGTPGLPPTLDRIPLETFGDALDALAARPSTDAARLGVVGVSRGGELALLLGACFARIGAVVAVTPSGVVWPAYPPTGHSAWTFEGREWPCSNAETYAACLARPDGEREGEIPVENIRGPVLLITGEADGLWPATALASVAQRRLERLRAPAHVEHLRYPEAGHDLAWPHGPTTMRRWTHPVSGAPIEFGGTAVGTARARADAWPRMLAFLRGALARD